MKEIKSELKSVRPSKLTDIVSEEFLREYCEKFNVAIVPKEPGREQTLKALHEIEDLRGKRNRESIQVFREFYRAIVKAVEGREKT
ncbi:MAG: hypothetical protein V6Z86_05495 [Hyphomicrobiales bacterium]